ncbi:PREDICTED: uncharacterized protein LOC107338777 isoform X1 [Acropora digitifera]|uniref:uncharacterized protein LOC107338777 isoform X1 n=1 Tax=Acropora digitifera TaxID=70779 RepID=UPI00077A8B70|nr:PREDICTED: uncharacterized protein LOC107338777 isoform X1 [Acropora digitifera]XP_015759498.1 PREDICTED: uncharacterized protein LOC107338777 isoform X1 [Acropora digitifera]
MPPTSLTKEQIDKLHELWEAGLTSVGDKRKIHAAVEATGLHEKTIKNWIGNERKRKGLATKRGPRNPENNMFKYMPSQKRKKSSYSVFKSTFLSSDQAVKMLADGHGPGEVQKQANVAYRQLSVEEMEGLKKKAEEENSGEPTTQIPRQRLIRKIKTNIHADMQKLDRMGCPSVWLGYTRVAPERLFSAQMADLAEDATFTNYVVSTMTNKLSSQANRGKKHVACTTPYRALPDSELDTFTRGTEGSQDNQELDPAPNETLQTDDS